MTSHLPEPLDEHDILDLTNRLQQDLRAAQAKLVTIRSYLAAQGTTERRYEHICPWSHCRIAFQTADRLAEHLANVHNGTPT